MESERTVVLYTPTGKEVTHGGSGTAYSNYGCRCEPCTEANKVRVDRRRLERINEEIPESVVHGRPGTYSNWSCRCEPCKTAWAKKCREDYASRKARKAAC